MSKSIISLRRAEVSDLQNILPLMERFHNEVKPRYPMTVTLTQLGEGLTDRANYIWIASDDEGVVGYVWAYPRTSDTLFCSQIYASKPGVSDLLVPYAIEEARGLGYRGVVIIALKKGWKAFKRWGLVPTGVILEMVFPPRELEGLDSSLDEE